MRLLATVCRIRQALHSFSPSTWMRDVEKFFAPSLQLAGMPALPQNEVERSPVQSVFDWAIMMAAPKSKISPSRKRQKHQSYYPDKVAWSTCPRCGEPKRPHRICTEHLEICAMRDEEYQEYLKKKEGNQ
eukprot:gene4195-4608_t